MQDKEWNNNISDKLKSQAPRPWDKEDMWSKISDQLPPEEEGNDKPFTFTWWPLSLAFLLYVSIALYLYTADHTQNSNTELAIINTELSESLSATEKKSQTDISIEKATHKTANTKSETSVINTKILKTKHSSFSKGLTKNKVDENYPSQLTNENQTANSPNYLNYEIGSGHLQTKNSINSRQEETGKVIVEQTPNRFPFSPINQLENRSILAAMNNDSLSQEEIDRLVNSLIFAPKQNWTSSIEVYGGYGLPMRSMSGDNSFSQSEVNNRLSTETPLDLKEAGLLLGFKYKSNFGIKIGLSMQQGVDRFEWDGPTQTLTQQMEYDSAFYFVGANSERSYISGVVEAKRTQNRSITHYNKHNYISLPILIGYNRDFGRWSTEVSAGFAMHLNYSFNGRFLSFNSPTEVNDPSVENTYKSNAGFGYLGAYKISYRLTPELDLFTQGTVQYNPSTLVRDLKDYQQRYHYVSLRLGLQKRIGKF